MNTVVALAVPLGSTTVGMVAIRSLIIHGSKVCKLVKVSNIRSETNDVHYDGV